MWSAELRAQALTQRGFVESSVRLFPQEAPNDRTRVVGDLLAREEAFYKPALWIQLAGGLDLRTSSHGRVEDRWRVDWSDRGIERPRFSLRRLSATVTGGPLTLDVGKQLVRWGKTDIVNPTDRFAPRDFLNLVDTEFLAVGAVRAVAQLGAETLEAVWAPRFTPSRLPLLNQRWTAVPSVPAVIDVVDRGSVVPAGRQTGIRWSHVGGLVEYSLSYFGGFNHLPNIRAEPGGVPGEIDITREYPPIRTYGADLAVPTRWFTLKGEAAYFTSSSAATDEYVLSVVQLERQSGEWVLVGGYAGEAVTRRRAAFTFAPDRGSSRAALGRASYTLDTNRSLAFEIAVKQNGHGLYAKTDYSQARGQHWRATISAVAIGGRSDDFLGQYRRNAHMTLALRYSF